jgi:hypothetical protein
MRPHRAFIIGFTARFAARNEPLRLAFTVLGQTCVRYQDRRRAELVLYGGERCVNRLLICDVTLKPGEVGVELSRLGPRTNGDLMASRG